MFDFLFRRTAKKPAVVQPAAQHAIVEIKARQEHVRQAALARAGALEGQEAAAVDFILQCEFADARLRAAAFIHSQPLQERVYSAMRNTDRRVAKLMQGKIEANLQQVKCEQHAQQCLERAQRLRADPQLMANQVADLDRDWSAIDMPAGQTRQAFEAVRVALHERLACQAQLQRALIDALNALRQIVATLEEASPDASAGALDQLALMVEQHAFAAEAPTLPKHLLPTFRLELDAARQKLAVQQQVQQQRQRQLSQCASQLAAWETEPASALDAASLRRQWQSLATATVRQPGSAEAELEARFEALLQTAQAAASALAPAQPVNAEPQPAIAPDTAIQSQEQKQRFADALDAMERALEQGLLQAASEHDRVLRAIDAKSCKPSAAQAPRLARARTELAHLMGWARWGGNVSREELLKTAEELPSQQLPLTELAKKLGSLRERWKSLDASAGPSSRELWQRFDAACNSAYEPLASHYRQLAEERQQNAVKAQALLEQLRSLNDTVQDAAAVDWKNVAQQCQRLQQSWSRQGTIERKERKRLDAEFAAALALLAEPLARQRAAAIERRERLIAEVTEIRADDRNAPEALRALQASWQQQSLTLPLERRDEQALWLRFRQAGDAVFAKRKETVQAADADRLQNLQHKEALCAELEAVTEDAPAALRKMLREMQDGWARIGHVPRAAEQRLERRFDAAAAVLQQRIDAGKRAAHSSELDALQRKLSLCQAVEAAVAQTLPPDQGRDWAAEWAALAALAAPQERALQTRFSAALAALGADDSAYAATLIDNRPRLGQELLRLEILLGCESPAILSRERLQMQVEVLQASLRTGQQQGTPQEQLAVLCALPVATDAESAQRIAALLQKIKTGT
ncbi:DUF349 domain-containing protein [Herminiimonas sp. CN]|uniref:DUF349 domain-containing protein n=1 Tax=Herminiimonas sp. CN TaxID=1349818 RepID=UPI0004730A90|nr:DUF349 domain-containing protein [Herminiimonas sp. CN]